ncbi:DUF4159 domain-containing protein [Candidatus Omnitrophota bacterium]
MKLSGENLSPSRIAETKINSDVLRICTIVIYSLVLLAVSLNCHAQQSNRPRGTSSRGEMISPDAYDTGTYKGFITRDPGNKQKYKGFIYIPHIQYKVIRDANTRPSYQSSTSISIDTVDDLRRYSPVTIKIDGSSVSLDSRSLFRYPLLVSPRLSADTTEEEKRNFEEYLRNGGFVMIGYLSGGSSRNIRDYFGSGAEAKPIPSGHFIYECCFNLSKETNKLTGLWIQDKLAGVFFNFENRSRIQSRLSEKNLKMGNNIIVYSLLREGSPAKKGF